MNTKLIENPLYKREWKHSFHCTACFLFYSRGAQARLPPCTRVLNIDRFQSAILNVRFESLLILQLTDPWKYDVFVSL